MVAVGQAAVVLKEWYTVTRLEIHGGSQIVKSVAAPPALKSAICLAVQNAMYEAASA